MPEVIVVGAGMGGLAAGIAARRNGFETTIFEAHRIPGGQCTSWRRRGYVFDACIHHLGAGSGTTGIDAFWRNLGALSGGVVPTREVAAALTADGTWFCDWYDLDRLEAHLKELSPADAPLVDDYLAGVRAFAADDRFSDFVLGTTWQKVAYLPRLLRLIRWYRHTLGTYGERFAHPLIRRAFPLMHSSLTDFPLFMHLVKHAYHLKGDVAWPRGGSLAFAQSLAHHFEELGGRIEYRSKVVRILTEGGRVSGVELEDGTRHGADYVISNADGRKTILELLAGRFLDRRTAKLCEPNPDDETPWSVMVFLGVARDVSDLPSTLILFLDEPVTIAGHTCDHLDLQTYGHDETMAPPGKGVIKADLHARTSYFEEVYERGEDAYEAEKDRIAEQVLEVLEGRFPGLRDDVEVVDVATLHAWERFMGGTHGYDNHPNRGSIGALNVAGSLLGIGERNTLPGLEGFWFAGQWVTSQGSLMMNALSGIRAVRQVCREAGVEFVDPTKVAPGTEAVPTAP